MERYKNKWFRLTLEKDLKTESLGVNVHCKEDAIYVTVPPYAPNMSEYEESTNLREDMETEKIVNKIKDFTKDYQIKVDLEKAVYGDNIKLKLKVENV